MPGVLLFVNESGAELAATTLELIGAGTQVAEQLGESAPVVLLAGTAGEPLAGQLGTLGIERVLVANSTSKHGMRSIEWLVAAAEQAVRLLEPQVVLLTHAAATREVGTALAYQLGSGIVTDSTALRVEAGELVISKPIYGGTAVAEYGITTRPAVVSLRARGFQAALELGAPAAQIEALEVADQPSATEVLEDVRAEAVSGPRLTDAKIVVSGGRGLGGPENWRYVEELADVLGAAVGATRAVTDAGWVSSAHQVGLTGSAIAPELYITIGISGAVQHVAGIGSARTVVAINRDAEANIFNYARYGVVGDWKLIVPAFIERLKELRA